MSDLTKVALEPLAPIRAIKRFAPNAAFARFDFEALYIYLIDILKNKDMHPSIETINLGTPSEEAKVLNRMVQGSLFISH
jgi:hypothetical protein